MCMLCISTLSLIYILVNSSQMYIIDTQRSSAQTIHNTINTVWVIYLNCNMYLVSTKGNSQTTIQAYVLSTLANSTSAWDSPTAATKHITSSIESSEFTAEQSTTSSESTHTSGSPSLHTDGDRDTGRHTIQPSSIESSTMFTTNNEYRKSG